MAAVPEGKVIRRLHGGPDALRLLLRDLKRYAFTGYVRTQATVEGEPAAGMLGVKGGELQVALRSRGSGTLRGNRALKEVWSDSRRPDCAIELHAKVDVDALVHHLSDALVERPRRYTKRPKPAVPRRATVALSPADLVRTWRAAGFDTRELEAKLAGEPQTASALLAEFARGVDRARALEQALDRISGPGLEAKVAEIRAMLRDLRLLALAKAEIEDIQAGGKAVSAPVLEPVAPAVAQGPERVPAPLGVIVRTRPAPEPGPLVRYELEPAEAAGSRDARTNLIRRYVFNSFVVGPSNRFAHAAALAVARSAKAAYNPLFITSGTGLGKTHLLNAIGNAVAASKPGTHIAYLSVEVFANEFHQARAADKLAEFRAKYRSVELFLLDDVHFLSGEGDVQEELFHTFDALTAAGKQIVLSSDRPPRDIPELEDRLVSRFESGLVADIQPPEFETRMEILRQRAAEVGGVPDDVLAAIAEAVATNVRELGGALNRVTAHASLLGQPVTIALAAAVLEDLKASAAGTVPGDPDLHPGRAYLVEEHRPDACFRLFGRIAEADGGLLITRLNPRWVRERYHLGRATVLWLTDHEGTQERTIAPQLAKIMYEIRSHLGSGGGGAILIDGVEYLVSNATFEAVLKFLRALVDAVSESPVVLLVSLSAEALDDQEVKTLERELEVLRWGD